MSSSFPGHQKFNQSDGIARGVYASAPDGKNAFISGDGELNQFMEFALARGLAADAAVDLPLLASMGEGHDLIVANRDPTFNVVLSVNAQDQATGENIEGTDDTLLLLPGTSVELRRVTENVTAPNSFWRVLNQNTYPEPEQLPASLAQVQVFSPAGVSQSDAGVFLDWDGDGAAPVVQVGAPLITLGGPNSSQITIGAEGAGWYRLKARTKLNGPLTTTFQQRITTGVARTPVPGTTTTEQIMGTLDIFMDSEAYIELAAGTLIVLQYLIDDGPTIFEVNFSANRVGPS